MPNNGSTDQPTFLHGDLDLTIIEARNLPNMDFMFRHLRRCFTACESFKRGGGTSHGDGDGNGNGNGNGNGTGNGNGNGGEQDINHHAKIITSDPYVTVRVPQAVVARTGVIKNAKNPQWHEHFVIQLAHPVTELEFLVKDNDVLGSQLIGTTKIKASEIITSKTIKGWFPILGSSGNPPKPETAIRLEMRFIPFDKNPMYTRSIAADPDHKGVGRTYFPLRKGNSVRLYQDAHVPDGMLPEIQLDGGKVYRQEKCWEDMCYAISEAHHLIYITGWSIYHKIKIVREASRPLPRGGDLNLGELLKYKSQEGVRVLLLVWDDKTSPDQLLINTGGVMQTHDEETRKFFKHSSVICVLAPRYASSKLSYIKQQVVGTLFTHHQKCVLVDTQGFGNNRKITAFLGGLDLCDGRYDTPEHRLLRDLATVFEGDFHQPTFPAGTKAPRQPWHDLHCRIDGPAAYDVLLNFEQRWRKSSKWTELGLLLRKRVSHWRDDALLKIERISWILSPSLPSTDGILSASKHSITLVPGDDRTVWVTNEDDLENWHVQIFRSIDSGSLKGFPKDARVAEYLDLNFAKDLAIDRSIQAAYIHAIRSAQHFIYIENQYFLGSSYGWPNYKNAGADNLVPMELALKIASKIKAHERFAVYVVIPMWPEGDPKSGAMQEILFWQSQTMQMMYNIVARELKSMQISDLHPRDYLNFYCLGNREELPEETRTANGTLVSDSYKFRRFMIYVHAKGMVVDDEYVIVGSANINQRSMAGTKDTEIAMGAYQPHQTWAAKNRHPHGQVYGYRMSLWAEHLGKIDGARFEDPWSLDCVRTVNKISEDNWQRYTSEKFMPLQGHLLRYPLLVDVDGKVGPLPGHENFPDVGGKVIGVQSPTLPDTLTT